MAMIFRLPPPGLIIRDFTIAALSTVVDLPMVKSIENEGDKVIVDVPEGCESDVLNAMFQESARLAERKIKEVFSPKLGKNDANVLMKFQEEAKQPVNRNASILEFALQVLKWAQDECNDLKRRSLISKFLMSLNSIQIKPSAMLLGGDKFAALQLFKVEKYEYGKDFMKGHDEIKLQIRHDVYWLTILMAGFALTYSGFSNNEMIFVTIPESAAFQGLKKPAHFFYSLPMGIVNHRENGISLIAHRVGVFDPFVAFVQLLSYEIVERWYKDFGFDKLLQAPIYVYKVRIGNTYTMIEKNIADLAPFTHFAYELIKQGKENTTLKRVKELLKNVHKLDYSTYYSLAMKFYQTISGSYDVYKLAYEIGRLSTASGKSIFNEEDVRGIINAFVT